MQASILQIRPVVFSGILDMTCTVLFSNQYRICKKCCLSKSFETSATLPKFSSGQEAYQNPMDMEVMSLLYIDLISLDEALNPQVSHYLLDQMRVCVMLVVSFKGAHKHGVLQYTLRKPSGTGVSHKFCKKRKNPANVTVQ